MSSWACKCVYYWPEHNAKGEPNGTAFQRSWNAETKDTKKKKKWGQWSSYHVFEYYANGSTKLVTDCAKFLNAPERSYWVFSEKVWLIDFAVTVC